jgi:hypothetical protein
MMAAMRVRAVIASLAAAALSLHALLPFFAVYHWPDRPAATRMAALFGETVLLCTSDGFRLVRWEDLQSGKEKPAPHQQYQCPLCYIAAQGQFIQPLWAAAVSPPQVSQAFSFPAAEGVFSSERHWRKLRTRSPPASFFS